MRLQQNNINFWACLAFLIPLGAGAAPVGVGYDLANELVPPAAGLQLAQIQVAGSANNGGDPEHC
jgi:hypothetical protein